MNHIVVGMGEALWDVLPEGKKLGGAPANFAYHVSQFGLDSRVVSAVGDDKLGTEILDNFREKGLNCMIEKVPYPTGTVQVSLDDAGVPCYDIKEGVAWDNIPYTASLDDLSSDLETSVLPDLSAALDDLADLGKEDPEQIELLLQTPGAALGSMSYSGSPHVGKSARLWKVVSVDGKEVEREKVNESHYSKSDQVVKVGTKSDNANAAAAVRAAIATQDYSKIMAAISQAGGA